MIAHRPVRDRLALPSAGWPCWSTRRCPACPRSSRAEAGVELGLYDPAGDGRRPSRPRTRQRAVPASVDSAFRHRPTRKTTSRMAAHAARRLLPMAENLAAIRGGHRTACRRPGVRLPRAAANQVLGARAGEKCRLRRVVPTTWTTDRYLYPDIQAAIRIVRTGDAVSEAGEDLLPRVTGELP